MASAESTYEERLRLADSFEGYKEYLSQAHFLFLVQEALEETRGGAAKIKYILALASRCKTGLVSVELLAKKIDKEYSLRPLQKEDGVREGQVDGWDDMDTDIEEVDDQNHEGQDKEREEEVPHDNDEVKNLIDTFGRSYFSASRWVPACKPFFIPVEDCLRDAHDIEMLRASTAEDFAIATAKAMPAHLKGHSVKRKAFECVFRRHERSYHLCKKVAVSFNGKIYRATNREIEAALKNEKSAPSTDAATYLNAVQEVRRQHATKRAGHSNSG